MLDFRLFQCRQLSWMILVILTIVICGCSSTTLTRKQRDAMEKHVDFVADAIYLSAVRIQKPLSEYHQKHGSWPTQTKDQEALFRSVHHILENHSINGVKLLAIDANEVLVEYYFSEQWTRQFPPLLESWLIVFSNKSSNKSSTKSSEQLEVAAIYPSWKDPETLARDLSLESQQIVQLQNSFRQKLHDKLTNYKLSLNENMNDPI